MKFLPLLAALAATVFSAALPAPKDSCPTSQDSFDWLALIKDLSEKGEIKITGPPDAFDDIVEDITRRWDVPGLHCGSSRALRCAASAGGAIAKCAQAALSGGADFSLDASCVQAAVDWGTDLPNDCKLCFGV